MPQSLVKNLAHLVFSTKHRQPWLPDDVREPLFAYQAGIFKQWESPALVIGGVEDHVHALFSLSKNHAFSVSESNVPDVRRSIENQPEHHRKMTFQDEFTQGDACGYAAALCPGLTC